MKYIYVCVCLMIIKIHEFLSFFAKKKPKKPPHLAVVKKKQPKQTKKNCPEEVIRFTRAINQV